MIITLIAVCLFALSVAVGAFQHLLSWECGDGILSRLVYGKMKIKQKKADELWWVNECLIMCFGMWALAMAGVCISANGPQGRKEFSDDEISYRATIASLKASQEAGDANEEAERLSPVIESLNKKIGLSRNEGTNPWTSWLINPYYRSLDPIIVGDYL